ncbi:MAG: hypothetical protein JSR80_06740 [Verrucomicrobia bacterium]|nr:hypothetical protein [Verrucomicrobiota bacterium]
MNTLPLTLTLLALALITSLTRLQTQRDQFLLGQVLLEHLKAERSLENAYQMELHTFKCSSRLSPKPKEETSNSDPSPTPDPDKKPPPKSFTKKRELPRYPSHLNLHSLHTSSLHVEVLRKLLIELFDFPYAEELSRQLAAKLGEIRPDNEFQGKVELCEQLACLDLGPLQASWAQMLRNGLLDYVAISRDPKINIAWAPRPLLIAIFESAELADQIILLREKIIDQYANEETSEKSSSFLKHKSEEFEKGVRLLLSHSALFDHYENVLDFSLRHKPSKVTLSSTSQLPLKRRRAV